MARVNIMLPDDLLERIDQVAQQEGVSRSKLLRLAFMAYCQQRDATYEYQRKQAAIEHGMTLQDSLRKKALPWDPLQLLRAERQEQ
ncbi:MAG: ribbon-helix-helix domain-containing protein [Gemmatimonadota bacterium]|nr:ribbon-helix-helix domain-containing protein [Gemmatimonadota bacterium]